MPIPNTGPRDSSFGEFRTPSGVRNSSRERTVGCGEATQGKRNSNGWRPNPPQPTLSGHCDQRHAPQRAIMSEDAERIVGLYRRHVDAWAAARGASEATGPMEAGWLPK